MQAEYGQPNWLNVNALTATDTGWCTYRLHFGALFCQVFMLKIWCWIMLNGDAFSWIVGSYIEAFFWQVLMPKVGVKLWQFGDQWHFGKFIVQKYPLSHGSSFFFNYYFHICLIFPYICSILYGCECMQIWINVNNIKLFSNLMDIKSLFDREFKNSFFIF